MISAAIGHLSMRLGPTSLTVLAGLLMSLATIQLVLALQFQSLATVLGLRFMIGALWFVGIALVVARNIPQIRWFHPMRGLLLLLNTGAFLLATQSISVALATAILFTFPIFVPLLAWMTSGARLHARSLVSAVFCALGVAVIMGDTLSGDGTGVILALIAALLVSMRIVWDGRLGRQDDKIGLTLWSAMFAGFGCLPFMAGDVVNGLDPMALVFITGAGLCATLSHYLIIHVAAQRAWSTISVYLFFEVPFTVVLGILFLGDTVTPHALLGIAIVMIAAISAARRT